ncbi:N-glycosidase [Penicillium rolfsii]|nr:N-glycosidase [Penicillium rolfsii]
MHRKALLFAGPNHPITQELEKGWKLHPRDVRALGRKIPNFIDKVWEQNRYAIVVEGNYLKFSQNENLKQKLFETTNRELVEASPRDRIWGVGFTAKDAGANRNNWGLNLLGKALMETREKLLMEVSCNKSSSGA